MKGNHSNAFESSMELALPLNAMPRTILRPDDTTRLPRGLRMDNHDRPRAASEDTRINSDYSYSSRSATPADDSPPQEGWTAMLQLARCDTTLLSVEETTELFKSKIEDARQDTQHALAGNEEVSQVVRPKLTLDLGHSKIARLPESVVDLIKIEVERLSLSHNQIWHIPLRFAECSQLRYLNIRTNVFREIPRGVRFETPLPKSH